MPTDGSSYAILSTGDASTIALPNTAPDTGTDLGGASVRGDSDFDVTILRVDLDVPSGTNCLIGLDFRFFSEEYPEFVGSDFNDAFVAELDNSSWTTSGSVISTPDNFAFDPAGNPITINAAGVTSMTANDAAGTTFDGATPLLRMKTPITPGTHSLYLSILDQGDHIYDSAVVIDNLRFGHVDDVPSECRPGAEPPGGGGEGTQPAQETFGQFGLGRGPIGNNATVTVADPVNTFTGAFVHQETDLAMASTGVPFEWTRTYTSADTASGRFGAGWTDTYQTSVVLQPNGDALVKGDDGQRFTFPAAAGGGFETPAAAMATLEPITGGYRLTTNDELVYL